MASASAVLCNRCLSHCTKLLFSPVVFLQQSRNGVNYQNSLFTFKIKPGTSLQISRKSSMHKNIYSALYDESSSSTKDFIHSLHPRERALLFSQMQKYEIKRIKAEGTGPSQPPSMEQLKILAFHNALPFIGFGFLDNLLMIVAGEYIDSTLGVTLGITTMAAAGLGNLISDVAGIGSATYVERLAMKYGLRTPDLTLEQWDYSKTRWTANLSKAFGVAFGCFIGMFPLLFYDDEDKNKLKETTNNPKETSDNLKEKDHAS